MIEFNGILTGKANKRFLIKQYLFYTLFLEVVILGVLPGTCMFAQMMNQWFFVKLMLWFLIVFSIAFAVPYLILKKEKAKMTPKKILIEGNYITYTLGDETKQTRLVEEVKTVYDFGEFYEIIYKGIAVNNFFCQKDHISSGTLDDFEALFGEKIIRKYK